MDRSMGQKLTAEFVGTFALVFIAAGAVISRGALGGVEPVLTLALAYGLAIAAMVTAVGHVSGAHLNPAVTAGAWVAQKIKASDAGMYILAQLAGGAAGAAALRFCFQETLWRQATLGSPLVTNVNTGQAILIEAILTFFLVWVVFATTIDPEGAFGKVAGITIGFTVAIGVMMAFPFTGAAMNPARWFGPALLSGTWNNALVWLVGPLAGGVIAASLYDMVILRPRGAGGPAEPGEAPHAWGAHGEDADATRGADEGAFGGKGHDHPHE